MFKDLAEKFSEQFRYDYHGAMSGIAEEVSSVASGEAAEELVGRVEREILRGIKHDFRSVKTMFEESGSTLSFEDWFDENTRVSYRSADFGEVLSNQLYGSVKLFQRVGGEWEEVFCNDEFMTVKFYLEVSDTLIAHAGLSNDELQEVLDAVLIPHFEVMFEVRDGEDWVLVDSQVVSEEPVDVALMKYGQYPVA